MKVHIYRKWIQFFFSLSRPCGSHVTKPFCWGSELQRMGRRLEAVSSTNSFYGFALNVLSYFPFIPTFPLLAGDGIVVCHKPSVSQNGRCETGWTYGKKKVLNNALKCRQWTQKPVRFSDHFPAFLNLSFINTTLESFLCLDALCLESLNKQVVSFFAKQRQCRSTSLISHWWKIHPSLP